MRDQLVGNPSLFQQQTWNTAEN
uniref:Uncharacterized protein n=1 Tax=Arundo donax TaxID=35708 RepID=A0A0A9BD50_ARUDO